MPHFTKQQIRRQNIVTLLVIVILIVSGLIAHGWFNHELLPVDADDQTRRVVVIPKGTTDKQAGTLFAMPMYSTIICRRTRRRALRQGAFI